MPVITADHRRAVAFGHWTMAYLKLFREMWRYAGADRWKVVLFVSFHILSHAYEISTPLVFGQILNTLQEKPEHILHQEFLWLCVYIGLFLWNAFFHRVGRYYELQVGFLIYHRFLNENYNIVTQLPLKWHTDHMSGDTINRLNKAALALRNFTSTQFMYIEYFIMLVGPIVMLSVLSYKIALIAFFGSSLIVLLIRYYDGKLEKIYHTINELEHRLASAIYDYISNIKTIIILKLGDQTAREVDHRVGAIFKPYMHSEAWLNGAKWFVVPFLDLFMGMGIIFVYIAQKMHRHQTILVGDVSAIYQYILRLSGAFMDLAIHYQTVVNWQVDYAAAAPIKSALDPQLVDKMHAINEWRNGIISELNFSYGEKRTIREVTFNFTKGEKIAFVGESGSGKSSLMAVLRGLYEPQSVALGIDGKNFDTLAPLAGITTLIPQEPEIFENTIRYNITFGVEHTDVEIMAAIAMARFDAVLERLPHGLDTDVRERGVTLSGGERQRLALARGLLAASDSAIILMDEPTSSVDAYNEALIYENIFETFRDRTVIASIHRLHLLNRFDRVIVMDQGRIVQTGTFDALKEADGIFKCCG